MWISWDLELISTFTLFFYDTYIYTLGLQNKKKLFFRGQHTQSVFNIAVMHQEPFVKEKVARRSDRWISSW